MLSFMGQLIPAILTNTHSWVYNTYAQTANKSNIVATAAGRVRVVNFVENGKVNIGVAEESRDKHRHSLIFSVRKSV
jgi:adenosine/AMP kinase